MFLYGQNWCIVLVFVKTSFLQLVLVLFSEFCELHLCMLGRCLLYVF